MFVIANRYGLSPDSRSVSWNSGSCVRGEQEATTTRFRRFCWMMSRMRSWLVSEHV